VEGKFNRKEKIIMTYESLYVFELGQAEGLVKLGQPNGNIEADGSRTEALFPLYSEMGDAEDLVELGQPNGNIEADGSRTEVMFALYSEE
jgi:hypothetical protein